jgi:CRP/FNR family transcriptional regulator
MERGPTDVDRDALWAEQFPELARCADPPVADLLEHAATVTFPAKQRVLVPGSNCENYLLVASGSIRVQVLTDTGREVTLYHVNAGDACVLTTSCLLSGEQFPAEGITETEVIVFCVPASWFNQALDSSPVFRRFVFKKFGGRLSEVIARMEQVCSVSIDRRLAAVLQSKDAAEAPIATTHQELAAELGTAREVVSRHLKQFESNGWVVLGRGSIQVTAPDVLARVAHGDP